MQNSSSNQSVWKILWEALTFNAHLYEDAIENPQATKLGQGIVILVAISHAIGSTVILLLYRPSIVLAILSFALNALSVWAGYYVWTFTIWKIGKWLSSSVPSFKKLLAPIGFAHTPQILNFLTVIPLIGRPIEIGLATWSLLAVIVAVREGLNLSLWRSIIICGIGWPIIQIAIGVVQVSIQEFGGQSF